MLNFEKKIRRQKVNVLTSQFTGAVLGDPEHGRFCDFSGWRERTGTTSSFAYVVVLMT